MGSAAAILIWLVILAAIAWFLVGGGLAALSGARGKTEKTERADPDDVLRYAVPEGQDPAAVVAALAPAGYVARLTEEVDTRVLVIAEEDGERPDRGRVRALIAQSSTTIQDPAPAPAEVRFLDEASQPPQR